MWIAMAHCQYVLSNRPLCVRCAGAGTASLMKWTAQLVREQGGTLLREIKNGDAGKEDAVSS